MLSSGKAGSSSQIKQFPVRNRHMHPHNQGRRPETFCKKRKKEKEEDRSEQIGLMVQQHSVSVVALQDIKVWGAQPERVSRTRIKPNVAFAAECNYLSSSDVFLLFPMSLLKTHRFCLFLTIITICMGSRNLNYCKEQLMCQGQIQSDLISKMYISLGKKKYFSFFNLTCLHICLFPHLYQ